MIVPEKHLDSTPWYRGITGYQWLILIIASAGWVFDVYEGQIFNITSGDLFNELLAGGENDLQGEALEKATSQWRDSFLAIFLVGGTLGGLLAGSLADRYGRGPVMIATILAYSLFSGLTFFATELWHVAALRFFVAMGVGGEWAVAAALVAEIFPTKARSQASAIFHASSVIGTWLAALAGWAVGANWRYAYLLGVLPALLIVWVRASVREPEQWQQQKETNPGDRMGSFRDLFADPRWRKHAILGMLLAAVGLGTFWSVTVAGQQLAKAKLIADNVSTEQATQTSKIAFGIIQTAGGGVGLLAFGPLCARLGRRKAFFFAQVLAFIFVPITCYVPHNYQTLVYLLPFFGMFTLGIHAGYAIYFPELFPTRLRATGTSLCFNGGRLIAVPVLLFSGWLKKTRVHHTGASRHGTGDVVSARSRYCAVST